MNKEELIKEYDEKAKALRDEFISKLEDDKKEFKLTYPEDEEVVFYIDSDDGEIYDTPYFANSAIDIYMFEHGLYFKTKEEAEQYLKERKLLFKLHQWAKLKNDGWEPDWEDSNENKYYIYCSRSRGVKEIRVDWSSMAFKFLKVPYFKTREIAKECIELFADEIIEVLS